MLSIHKEWFIWRLHFRRCLSEMVDNEQHGTFAAARATSARQIGVMSDGVTFRVEDWNKLFLNAKPQMEK